MTQTPAALDEWHVVVCPDGEYPYCVNGDLLDCVDKLTEIFEQHTDTVYFIFYGQRAWTSKPPDRYLLWPDGVHRTPLFHIPVDDEEMEVEIDREGRAGTIDQDILNQSIEDDESDDDEDRSSHSQPSVMAVEDWQAGVPQSPEFDDSDELIDGD